MCSVIALSLGAACPCEKCVANYNGVYISLKDFTLVVAKIVGEPIKALLRLTYRQPGK